MPSLFTSYLPEAKSKLSSNDKYTFPFLFSIVKPFPSSPDSALEILAFKAVTIESFLFMIDSSSLTLKDL